MNQMLMWKTYANRVKKNNRSFTSYLVPLFKNESFYQTFHMQMSLIHMKMNV